MRKLVLFFLFALLPFAAQAQLKFGYLSYSGAIKMLPGYTLMQENMARLKAQYDKEAQRAEDDFNAKYQAFLEVQNTLATPILRKRQAELQELIDKNVAFKAEAERLLKQAEADMYAPLKTQLNEALKRIGLSFLHNRHVNTSIDVVFRRHFLKSGVYVVLFDNTST